MSLATRCPSCGTVFRVVQDQLKVSEGWVRCGRCDEVFSALEGLFDLDHDAAPAWPAPDDDASFEPHPRATLAESTLGRDPVDSALVDRIDAQFFRPQEAAEPDPLPQAEAPAERIPVDDPEPVWSEPAASAAVASAEAVGAPEFVRHAERQARWQQPRVRLALAALALLLLLALGAQWAIHFRDQTAARWPTLKPALATWCAAWQCRIEAPRRIEDISVENTTLTRAAGPDAFHLTVTLRNRGNFTLTLPSIDLSLTDSAGQLIARRALAPADFRVASPLLAPGAESPLQLLLTAGTPRVTGYTVEIFYP